MRTVRLIENPPSSAVLWPVFVALALCFVVGGVTEVVGVDRYGVVIASVLCAAIFLTGGAFSLVYGFRKARARVALDHEIAFEADRMRLIDRRTGATLVEAPIPALSIVAAQYATGEGDPFPVISIGAPGRAAIHIATMEGGAGRNAAAKQAKPDYWVELAGWKILVDALVKDEAEGSCAPGSTR
jgi:hypothetical protein